MSLHAIRPALLAAAATLLASSPAPLLLAQEPDYHAATEALGRRGQQALITCNGLFVSERSPERVSGQELRLDGLDPLPPERVAVDRDRRTVRVGGGPDDPVPAMRAAWREGLGCVVLSPDQTFDDVDTLPELRLPPPPGDPEEIPWPDGDLVPEEPLPPGVDGDALDAAGEWAFDRATHGHPSQVTLSLLVVHRGRIAYERYAPGVDRRTRTRTWSAAKSIASTLIGIAVGRGLLELDAPLPFAWEPDGLPAPERDPRRRITLRHVLNMSSGLYPGDNRHRWTHGSYLVYWAGASYAAQARDRGLVREPGTAWDYENFDTLLGVLALKTALGGGREYLEFPRRALFDRIGMRSTVPGVDRFGDFVLSSQVYTNARDLARLGLLYLNRGTWNGERILPEEWLDFVRTPAPATEGRGRFYGGQWWLVPDGRADLPQDAYTMAGSRGQYAIVVPSRDLVVVRRGLDAAPGRHPFPEWDLLAEVLKGVPGGGAGAGGRRPGGPPGPRPRRRARRPPAPGRTRRRSTWRR